MTIAVAVYDRPNALSICAALPYGIPLDSSSISASANRTVVSDARRPAKTATVDQIRSVKMRMGRA
jgi:hypothetical protein